MKKSYKLILSLILVLPVFTGFSQGQRFKSVISPALGADDCRFSVTATVMDNDTWCRVEWPDPVSNPWEMAFDDGEADDFFIYSTPGNLNANKFIPTGHPFIVTGGKIFVGDSTFPGPFLGTSFRVLVYDDDGDNGLPGTALDSMDVTVNNYEWVEFEGMTAEITEGDFYLAMKQLAPAPDAAPIGVDMDNPTYFNSYSYFLGAPGWVSSPLQDFMIRAWITGYNEPSRAIDSFEVARFSGFEYNESPLTGDTTVLDTITLSEYNDYEWNELDPGLYAYGVKTHFTSGEWSDYDVSNLVMHIFYPFPPGCFFQADTGNQPLMICPPTDLNGALPNYFLGFNVYVDGDLDDFLPPSATSYLPSAELPGIYTCSLTAVYDLAIFGYPNETIESSELTTEYIISYGLPLPFLEQWNSGTFETNNWLTDGANWSINWQEGQPDPSAEFTWDPIQTDYQVSLESYPLQADSITEGQIYLDFDIKLDNYLSTGTEQMLVQVWNWNSQEWTTVQTYTNEEDSFDWKSEHLDITSLAIETVFKIRFLSIGESSLNIVGWYVDNIHVYRECKAPYGLTVEAIANQNEMGFLVEWENPYGPDNGWIEWDDGVNAGNSIGTGDEVEFDVAARWEPSQLSEYYGYELVQVAFFPAELNANYNIRVWTGENASTLLVDQSIANPTINQWNEITLTTPVMFDVTQELWVGYHVTTQTGYPAGVDDGPAIDGYGNMMNFGGWQTLLQINPSLDYNWNIKAYLSGGNNNTVTKYAVYRSNDGAPYFFKAFSELEQYLDESDLCEYSDLVCFQVTAIYSSETDSCESIPSNESCELCPGFNENEQTSKMLFYPNPTSDVLFIESSEQVESVSIFDSRGCQVVGWSGGQEKEGRPGDKETWRIPVNGLAPGLYLVRVEAKNLMINRKIVIK